MAESDPHLSQGRPRADWPWLLWVLLVLGLAVRLVLALLPLSQLLILLEDDAWMVAAIARNFALGLGITADGLNPTNGFHPLYPLALGSLPYLIAPQALDVGFRVNLIFCALLGTAAAIPLYRLTRRFAGQNGALLAVALYTLNPLFARVTVNAMETALGLLLLLWLAERFYAVDHRRWQSTLGLGLLAGLTGLARLDNGLLAAMFGLVLLWEVVRRRATPAALVAYGLGGFLLAAPYFVFNYVVLRTLGPSSGRALSYMHSYVDGFSLTNILHFIYLNPALSLEFLPSPLLALGIALALVAAYLFLLPKDTRRALGPLAAFVLLQLIWYAYLQQNSNPRYFVAAAAFFCLLLGCLYARLEPVLGRIPRLAVAVGLVLLAGGLNTYEVVHTYRQNATMPQLTQPAIYDAALWIRDNLPADALLAAKNSGILQYYSGHVVLNIDGKLNAEIVPVLEERQLLAYLRRRGVQYLVDREAAIAGHVTLYSVEFGPWPPHREVTLLQRVEIYAQLLLNRFGLGAPPALDDPSGFRPTRPFSDVVQVMQTFPRPNSPVDPVIVYRLLEP
jgi:hypothetical protein